VRAGWLLGCVLLGVALVQCTVTPDFFPACVNPYVDTCPAGDASADGDDEDGSGDSAPDGTTPDGTTPDATAPDATAPDSTISPEAGQVTM
jgi:hypothetical protein